MICIIGFKHVGKTRFGKALASSLCLEFADLDEEIKLHLGEKIRPYIAKHGIQAFREVERLVLQELLDSDFDGVLAVGGGTPIYNADLFEGKTCLLLKGNADKAWNRIQKKGETTLFKNRAEFDDLWEERMPVYKSLATFSLEEGERLRFNAVVGSPLKHTQSPTFHNKIYREKGWHTVLLPLPIEEISTVVRVIRNCQIPLTAVTMPHKESILPFLDEVDGEARQLGAVNTVIQKEGKLHGFNTDIHGIEVALQKLDLKDKKALILGAGGAAKAVAHVLKKKGAKLLLHNRTLEKAEALQAQFGGEILKNLAKIPEDLALVVNATPAGPQLTLPKDCFAFDLVYEPKFTPFLESVSSGQGLFGLDMFSAQALKQIELFDTHCNATD